MLAIANARGVPGMAAAVVTGVNGARFVLSCHHVLFGDGARVGDRVWGLDPGGEPVLLGRTANGELGRVGDSNDPCFVDCGLIALAANESYPPWLRGALDALVRPATLTRSTIGASVVKDGAATGETRGTIASDCYSAEPWLEGRAWTAPGQLLVDSSDAALVFSAPGDSGAALVADDGSVIGLLWGTTPDGRGIASPIAPVLASLHVEI